MADKNIHSGHRARLKQRFLKEGLSSFEKHNMLELLLFYCIPQKDTNPIAHELLNRFGSLRGVFEAMPEELCQVDGISEHSATLIKLVPQIFEAAASEVDTSERYTTLSKLGQLMVKRYSGVSVEAVFLILMDNSYRIIEIVKLDEGSVNRVRLDTRKLVEVAIRKNAAMAVLCHNHPNGSLAASPEDIEVTATVANAFRTIHVEFLEHLLVAGDKYDGLLARTEGVFWQKSDREKFYK